MRQPPSDKGEQTQPDADRQRCTEAWNEYRACRDCKHWSIEPKPHARTPLSIVVCQFSGAIRHPRDRTPIRGRACLPSRRTLRTGRNDRLRSLARRRASCLCTFRAGLVHLASWSPSLTSLRLQIDHRRRLAAMTYGSRRSRQTAPPDRGQSPPTAETFSILDTAADRWRGSRTP